MASLEPVSIHIHPASCESPSSCATSSSLDTLCPQPAAPTCRSYSDAAIHSTSRSRKLRDELEHFCSQLKHKGAKLNRRMSALCDRLHSTEDNKSRAVKRHIKVEYVGSDSAVHSEDDDEDGDTLELPDHNYSPSLQLTDLRDGCFTAELPLDALPTGHITIRIRNYKMEVIVGRRSSVVDDSHCISCPVRYGDIDIPIYVNPATLNFEMDNDGACLYVRGLTKGYSGRSLSIPENRYFLDNRNFTEGTNKLSRSRSCHKSPERSASPRRSLTVSCTPSGSFRRRARTH